MDKNRKVKKLKIALLCPQLTYEGGGERQVLQLAYNLQEADHTVHIFTRQFLQEKCYPALSSHLTIYDAGLPLTTRSRLKEFILRHTTDVEKVAQLVIEASVTQGGYDILNAHVDPMQWCAALIKRKIRKLQKNQHKKVPIIWMCNDLPQWHVQQDEGYKQFSLLKKKVMKTAYAYFRIKDKKYSKEINTITVLDQRNQRLIQQTYHKNAIIVRSGINTQRFEKISATQIKELRKKYALEDGDFILLCVSILMPHRRIEDVLDALCLLKDKIKNNNDQKTKKIKFLIVGSEHINPAYSAFLKQKVHELNLDNQVIFTGAVDETILPAHYACCDVFIYPHVHQTWGLAVLEALACQKPAIVSTETGVSEILTNNVNALLIPPRNPGIIAQEIECLYYNKELRKRLGKEGKHLVTKQYTDKKYTVGMLKIYYDAIDKLNDQKVR